MLKVSTDRAGVQGVISRLQYGRSAARRRALVAATRPVVQAVLNKTPRDTNRMARGFELAGNTAGVGPFIVSPVKASRYFNLNRQILGEQAAGLRREYQQARSTRIAYERSNRAVLKGRGKSRRGAGRQSSYYRKLVSQENKLLNSFRRAVAQKTQLTESSVLIYNKGRRVNVTVRNRIYGGDGDIIHTRDTSICRITNREPHAIIRARANNVVAPALVLGRTLGARSGRREYLRVMKQMSPKNIKQSK